MAQTPATPWRGKPSAEAAFPAGAPDRSPPHSPEAEEHVIACCLLDGSDTIARCLEARLTAEAFYSPANRLLFETIVEVYQKSPPVSLEILAEELKTRRQLDAVGGYPYLLHVSSTPSAATRTSSRSPAASRPPPTPATSSRSSARSTSCAS
jgi:hypothetical protein